MSDQPRLFAANKLYDSAVHKLVTTKTRFDLGMETRERLGHMHGLVQGLAIAFTYGPEHPMMSAEEAKLVNAQIDADILAMVQTILDENLEVSSD